MGQQQYSKADLARVTSETFANALGIETCTQAHAYMIRHGLRGTLGMRIAACWDRICVFHWDLTGSEALNV